MKIAFYIHHTTIKAGGIFTYSIGVLNLLLSSDEIEKIFLIVSEKTKEKITSLLKNHKITLVVVNRSNFFVKLKLSFSYLAYDIFLLQQNYSRGNTRFLFLKKFSAWINPYRSIIKKLDADVLHIPIQYSPIYGIDIPLITTMHDVQELIMPENFSASDRLHRALNSKKAVDESDQIIVSFKHVKEDVIKYFGLNDGQISVCPPPFHEEWFVNKNATLTNELISKYNLQERFILYPAATWKHKNHVALFRALALLKEKNFLIQLICTGNQTNYSSDLIIEAENIGIENQVKFLGIVSEEDLVGLYKMTSLVVIPTTYEAGSGPLYEAMRYGAPVICSNVTSLPDAIGNNDFTFDPNDYQRIANLIINVMTDEEFRKRNIDNSKLRIEHFQKQDYVSNFVGAYKKAIQHKKGKAKL